MDLDMLNLSWGDIPVGIDSRKVEMGCWRLSHVVDLGSINPGMTAEALGESEFPKGGNKMCNG